MQSFIVLASLVSELAGGHYFDTPLVLKVTKKHLSPLKVKNHFDGWVGLNGTLFLHNQLFFLLNNSLSYCIKTTLVFG